MSPTAPSHHAVCAVIGEAGILLRGPSGSGKTYLGLLLVARAEALGVHGALVADDRVRLAAVHGRLIARAHPAIAGRAEIRGHGLVAVPHLDAAVVRLVVDLEADRPRLPEPARACEDILGVGLPRLVLDPRQAGALAPDLVLAALGAAFPGSGVSSQPHIAGLAVRGAVDP